MGEQLCSDFLTACPFLGFDVRNRTELLNQLAIDSSAGRCFCIQPLKDKEMIRKLKSGEYRLYSRKKDAKTGKRRNLGTFSSMEKAKAHERAVQYFKRH